MGHRHHFRGLPVWAVVALVLLALLVLCCAAHAVSRHCRRRRTRRSERPGGVAHAPAAKPPATTHWSNPDVPRAPATVSYSVPTPYQARSAPYAQYPAPPAVHQYHTPGGSYPPAQARHPTGQLYADTMPPYQPAAPPYQAIDPGPSYPTVPNATLSADFYTWSQENKRAGGPSQSRF